MAVYTHVSAESLGAFLARYDVGELVSAKGIAEGVENSNYLVDTTRGRYILTLYERRVAAGDLPFFMALLDHLAAKGLPVPPAIKDRNGVAIQELEGRPACLIRFLPGVSVSTPTPEQARAAARAMGDMHRAVSDFGESRPNEHGAGNWLNWLVGLNADLDRIAPQLYRRLGVAMDRIVDDWPVTGSLEEVVIHADLFPDNVLMRGDAVTGLIDFYFASTDFRIYDLAVMHSAWTFGSTGEPANPAVGRALLTGYADSMGLTSGERAALPILAQGACMRFILTRAFDWLNTPADALVTRKDPLAYLRRLDWYQAHPEAFA